ncbi:uncharacterized protein C3orf20-like isoform X2 [Otolemur garnettii]|uniref:uncharacterized protein C3orf20-like isoform X2 n=1 Tax=Otolemur garnettii TaxID=30611 RepID=UPI000C7EA85E|nr:uncharacterized protein C3orf20-like isoform X2 [Otolemur garnettii]
MYTNIFSDLPNQVILGTFTPFGCGSISFPKRKIIAMMFNQDGGMVISKKGHILREWMWPSKGKLDDPVEVWVNRFITVKISGRFAITLVYKWHPQSLKLSLAPVKCKPCPPCLPEMPSSLADPVDIDTFDPSMDISPLHDIITAIKLRRLQRKVKHIFFDWLNHYRFTLGMESLHLCKTPVFFPQKMIRKQEVSSAKLSLKQGAKEKDEEKEYLRYRNTFLELKGVFKPLPLHGSRRTPTSHQSLRVPLPIESKDTRFASPLFCPVVLRRMLCGQEGDICRCSSHNIPEVTDLEYDHLISRQLASVDQIVVVCVFSPMGNDKTINEVDKMYRELNRSRSMPCIQSRLDSFRLLKYNIISASKFTGSNCPLLIQRHNVVPGIFLMYIRGRLLFANFVFNGYSTSSKDLQKQIVKTRNDYQRGYFLPDDFRIWA